MFNLPVTGDESPMFPRKRKTAKCCGIVFCGPFGWETKMGIPCKGQENFILPFNSHEWPKQNFSLQYQYNINQISDENKGKYQFRDN